MKTTEASSFWRLWYLTAVLLTFAENTTRLRLLYLPQRSSHKSQSLERGCIGTLKTAYVAEADKWMHDGFRLAFTHSRLCQSFRNAYETVSNTEKGKILA
jgi:hypothetical protein